MSSLGDLSYKPSASPVRSETIKSADITTTTSTSSTRCGEGESESTGTWTSSEESEVDALIKNKVKPCRRAKEYSVTAEEDATKEATPIKVRGRIIFVKPDPDPLKGCWDQVQNKIAFRVTTAASAGTNEESGIMAASIRDSSLPLLTRNDLDFARAAVNHLCRERVKSPFISVWLKPRSAIHRLVRNKDAKLFLIDAEQLSTAHGEVPKIYAAKDLIEQYGITEAGFSNGRKYVYHGGAEFLVYQEIGKSAILKTISSEDFHTCIAENPDLELVFDLNNLRQYETVKTYQDKTSQRAYRNYPVGRAIGRLLQRLGIPKDFVDRLAVTFADSFNFIKSADLNRYMEHEPSIEDYMEGIWEGYYFNGTEKLPITSPRDLVSKLRQKKLRESERNARPDPSLTKYSHTDESLCPVRVATDRQDRASNSSQKLKSCEQSFAPSILARSNGWKSRDRFDTVLFKRCLNEKRPSRHEFSQLIQQFRLRTDSLEASIGETRPKNDSTAVSNPTSTPLTVQNLERLQGVSGRSGTPAIANGMANDNCESELSATVTGEIATDVIYDLDKPPSDIVSDEPMLVARLGTYPDRRESHASKVNNPILGKQEPQSNSLQEEDSFIRSRRARERFLGYLP